MKKIPTLIVLLAGFLLAANLNVALAAERDPSGPDQQPDRMQGPDRRPDLRHPEQFARQRLPDNDPQSRFDRRPPGPLPDPAGLPPAPPQVGLRQPEVEKFHRHLAGLIRICFLGAIVFNITMAIWIYGDIRKRGQGSGIFILLALIAGIPAGIIYALVRIGDRPASATASASP